MPPLHHTTPAGGIDLSWWEWNADLRGAAPTLLFAHATGFHGRVWDALIEHLPSRHIIALDLHGHGRSTGAPITDWRVLWEEVQALLAGLSLSGVQGVGHSMGAHALLQCAANEHGLFDNLVLFDPVILSPEWYEKGELAFDDSQPHPTARRKRDFASPEAMIERFSTRDPYDLFQPRVLADYCRYGLIEKPDGDGFELACAPEMEASVYMSSRSNPGILDAATELKCPVLVVRAAQGAMGDFKSSPTWPDLASTIPNGTDMPRPDMTHFHPFQDPGDAAKIVSDWFTD